MQLYINNESVVIQKENIMELIFSPFVKSSTQTTDSLFFFFLNDPAPTEIYPLPLHAALPICLPARPRRTGRDRLRGAGSARRHQLPRPLLAPGAGLSGRRGGHARRRGRPDPAPQPAPGGVAAVRAARDRAGPRGGGGGRPRARDQLRPALAAARRPA